MFSPLMTRLIQTKLWCNWKYYSRGFSVKNTQNIKQEHLKTPEFNWDFLLDPQNKNYIEETIKQRKGIGNISKLLKLQEELSTCKDPGLIEELRNQLVKEASYIPNVSHPDSPVGDESNAKTVFVNGKKPSFNFQPKTVVEVCEGLGILRTNNVNLTTGNKTYYFIDKLAKLERALINYSLDNVLRQGFELVSVPDLLNPEIVEACGFKTTGPVSQVYHLDHEPKLCLSGTAELSLGAMHTNELISLVDLPKKYVAVSRCYRVETSNLEHEHGIYRVHQFYKVEMFGITANDSGTESDHLLQEFVDLQKRLFSGLGLHFRLLDMPTQELGAPAYRKFDFETWMPGKGFYGEISSASNCTDYQTRRLHIKYVSPDSINKHCHTVNGTACALPRIIMALIETNQTEDGTISIPESLRPYTQFSHIDYNSTFKEINYIQ